MLLVQKNSGPHPKTINDTTRLFFSLADLNYEPGYNNHIYFQYLSNNKNDISLLGVYHPEEIYSKYIIRVAGKGFTVVDHPSEVYGFSDIFQFYLIKALFKSILFLFYNIKRKSQRKKLFNLIFAQKFLKISPITGASAY